MGQKLAAQMSPNYSPILMPQEVSEAGIAMIESAKSGSIWSMHLNGTKAFEVPDPFENLEDLLKFQIKS